MRGSSERAWAMCEASPSKKEQPLTFSPRAPSRFFDQFFVRRLRRRNAVQGSSEMIFRYSASDHARAVRMAGLIPADVVKVAESGVRGRHYAAALRAAGSDAVLVGAVLVTAVDPAAVIADLSGGPRVTVQGSLTTLQRP